jgi:hypothetical protein
MDELQFEQTMLYLCTNCINLLIRSLLFIYNITYCAHVHIYMYITILYKNIKFYTNNLF